MVNTLTLNPAIDKILYIDKFQPGITNRIQKHKKTIGGKGTHVSMNLSQMGIDNRAFGLARGSTGRLILQSLEEWGVHPSFIFREDGESRTNYILLENNNTCTTLAEKGPALTEEDMQVLLDKMEQEIADEDFLVLSGDASNCQDPFVYNHIAKQMEKKNLKIFLDASGETLRKGLELSPFLIKPNQDELEALCGFPIINEEDVLKGIGSLACYNIEVVAVSLGGQGAVVKFGKEYYKTVPPTIAVSNTAGCGDSFLAALLYGYEKQMPQKKMLHLATAVSAATAASPLSVGFDSAYAENLLGDCKVTQIG